MKVRMSRQMGDEQLSGESTGRLRSTILYTVLQRPAYTRYSSVDEGEPDMAVWFLVRSGIAARLELYWREAADMECRQAASMALDVRSSMRPKEEDLSFR